MGSKYPAYLAASACLSLKADGNSSEGGRTCQPG